MKSVQFRRDQHIKIQAKLNNDILNYDSLYTYNIDRIDQNSQEPLLCKWQVWVILLKNILKRGFSVYFIFCWLLFRHNIFKVCDKMWTTWTCYSQDVTKTSHKNLFKWRHNFVTPSTHPFLHRDQGLVDLYRIECQVIKHDRKSSMKL